METAGKEGLIRYGVAICTCFTGIMTVYLAIGWVQGDAAVRAGIALCAAQLLVAVAVATLQFVFFTPHLIRRMRYTARLALFAVCLYASILGIEGAVGVIPLENPVKIGIFTGIFLVILAVNCIAFEVYYRRAGKSFDEALAAWRKSRGMTA